MRSAYLNAILLGISGLLGPAICWGNMLASQRFRVSQDTRALAIARTSCARRWSVVRAHMALSALSKPAQLGGWAVFLDCHQQLPHAFESARRGAQRSDPLAEAMLGHIELQGIPGVFAANRAAGLHWTRASARQGLPYGEYQFGLDLWRGVGGRHDTARAIHWMKSAAAAGSEAAQRWLAAHQTHLPPATDVAASTPRTPPSAQSAAQAATVTRSSAAVEPQEPAAPPADDQRVAQSLRSFWILYFNASNAKVVDFGAPALVQPVDFGRPP